MHRKSSEYKQSLPTFLKPVHFLQAALVFLVLAGMLLQLAHQHTQADLKELRATAARSAVNYRARLDSDINATIHLADGLAATIVTMPDIGAGQLTIALRTLYRSGKNLRNIGVAPGNRITAIYPLRGNEGALGLYYPDHPDQWPAVRKAIEGKTPVLAGPIDLVQGGKGLVYRTPVYLDDGAYWGLLSMVLDIDSLLASVQAQANTPDFDMAIRSGHGDDTAGRLVTGDESVFGQDPELLDLHIPGGDWELGVVPRGGWERAEGNLDGLVMLGMLFCALVPLGLLLYQAINTRTQSSETRLRSILNTTRDGIIVIDTNGNVRDLNPAAERMFGYDSREIVGLPVSMLMPSDSQSVEELFLNGGEGSGQVDNCFELSGLHRQGSRFPLEVTIGQAMAAGRRLFVWVLRDITERKSVEERLRLMATTDPLTGAMNRRAFMDDGDKLFNLARRFGRPLSVMAFDADYFKKINDTFGHDAGDRVLVAIVQHMKSSLRRVDLVARFGGEEFMVLLPETDGDKAMLVAEKLRKSLSSLVVKTDGNCSLRFTCSVGVTALEPGVEKLSEMLAQADRALYRAKQNGRNQTLRHEPVGMAEAFPEHAQLRRIS